MKFATQAGLISTIKLVIQNNDIDPAEFVDKDVSQNNYTVYNFIFVCPIRMDGHSYIMQQNMDIQILLNFYLMKERLMLTAKTLYVK